MSPNRRAGTRADGWKPIDDPERKFSSGIPDFDRLLGGGFARGSLTIFGLDETVGREELDLLLFPIYLNHLYHSRGIVAILPSNDSPHEFRERLTRHVTRRRFDSRVRVMDYVGEDKGPPYVVNMPTGGLERSPKRDPKVRRRAIALAVEAEKRAQGGRGRPFVELCAFEIFDTLMGSEAAQRVFFHGVKRSKELGNLAVGILGPGVGCAPAMRRMADTEFALHRDEVGLTVRGVRPSFPSHLVATDSAAGPPHVVFLPTPVERTQ
jgi:hypothetical protein